MAINFKLLFQQTGKLLLFYTVEARGLYYSLPFNRNKTHDIKILPGHTIKYASKGDIAEIIYKKQVLVKHKKSFEYTTLELFSTLLKEGDVIVDVGANSGLYSIFYSKLVGKTGAVLAFEPDKETFALLQENIKLNNCTNIATYNLALSNKASIIEMVSYDPEGFKPKDGDSFKYIKELEPGSVSEDGDTMTAVKMDDMPELQAIKKIDYIKIDVEGAELLVLQGAIDTIAKHKPVIIFELSGKWTRRFNYKPYHILVLLKDLGYEMDEYDVEQWIAKPIN